MCNDQHIAALGFARVFETRPVVFLADIGDHGVKATDDIFGRSVIISNVLAWNDIKGEKKKKRTPHQDTHDSKYPTAPHPSPSSPP